jgi:short-subunit dehydrogenase
VISLPLAVWYYASKHTLEAFSDTLRQEVGRFGINVVVIEPVIIKTDFEKETAKKLREVSGHGPYQNIAEALAKQTENMFISGIKRSDPIVVAKAILDIVESPAPKTRDSIGYMAKLVLAFIHWQTL